jgi:hypothetical protein
MKKKIKKSMGGDEKTNTNKQIRNKTNTHKKTPGSEIIEFQS